MANAWQHTLCAACFTARYPGRRAQLVLGAGVTICCACRETNSDGIFTREDPQYLACEGLTGYHEM